MYEVIASEQEELSLQIVDKFLSYLDVSFVTVRAYSSGIRQFMKYLAIEGIAQPRREDVLSFKQFLQFEGRRASTISMYLTALRRFFDWTESERLYPNVARGVKSPKQDKGHKRDYLTGSQITEMLNRTNSSTVEGARNHAILLLMAACGLRTIEIVRANVGDLREIDSHAVLYVQGKGRSDRTEFVKLSAPVLEAVRAYLATRGQARDSEPLFVSHSRRNAGHRLTTRTVSGVAKRTMRECGYDSPRLTAHSLRHSAATLALQAGMRLDEVQAFMRHSSISITMVYNHSLNRLNSQCEAAVTSAIFGGGFSYGLPGRNRMLH